MHARISDKRRLLVLFATIVGSVIVFLDGSIVNLALPKIGAQLHAGFSDLQWIVDSYALMLSALILLGGSIGDILGHKRIYMIGLMGFGASSLFCALSPNVTMLIILRTVQGLFGAMLVPGALAIINTNFPKEERGTAIGYWTAWSSMAMIIAPLLGGFLLDITSWRAIFLINIPLAIVCAVVGIRSMTESRDGESRKIDWIGAALEVLALAGMTYGLIEGPIAHWSLLTVASLVMGLVLFICFVMTEAKVKYPMIPLNLFKSRNFTGSNLMTFAMYGALAGFGFSLVIYLQTKMHYSSIKAGMSMLPTSILLILGSGRVGAVSGRIGPRLFMTMGPILSATGMILLIMLKPGQSFLLHVLPGIIVFGLGVVCFVAPLTTTVMTSVPDRFSGTASGVNNAVSRTAGLLVIAVLGLTGSGHAYAFGLGLCIVLAIGAGLVSLFVIENKTLEEKATEI